MTTPRGITEQDFRFWTDRAHADLEELDRFLTAEVGDRGPQEHRTHGMLTLELLKARGRLRRLRRAFAKLAGGDDNIEQVQRVSEIDQVIEALDETLRKYPEVLPELKSQLRAGIYVGTLRDALGRFDPEREPSHVPQGLALVLARDSWDEVAFELIVERDSLQMVVDNAKAIWGEKAASELERTREILYEADDIIREEIRDLSAARKLLQQFVLRFPPDPKREAYLWWSAPELVGKELAIGVTGEEVEGLFQGIVGGLARVPEEARAAASAWWKRNRPSPAEWSFGLQPLPIPAPAVTFAEEEGQPSERLMWEGQVPLVSGGTLRVTLRRETHPAGFGLRLATHDDALAQQLVEVRLVDPEGEEGWRRFMVLGKGPPMWTARWTARSIVLADAATGGRKWWPAVTVRTPKDLTLKDVPVLVHSASMALRDDPMGRRAWVEWLDENLSEVADQETYQRLSELRHHLEDDRDS